MEYHFPSVAGSIAKLSTFTILLLFLLSCFTFSATEAYDALDPTGNITIKWDIMSWTPDGYVAVVTMYNFQQYRHIQAPGWTLGWTWAKKEVIWSMMGGQTTEQGDCSKFKGNIPHCCKKDPTIVDLLPGTPYNQQIANCCKGGVINSWTQDPATAVASFQVSVGRAVIKAFCVKGSWEEAVDVFREMEESRVTPSAFAYSTYIEGLCMHGRPNLGLEVLRALTNANVPVPLFAFTVLIRSFCNDMKLKEAESILLEMEKLGFVPDVYVYGALICGFCRVGKLLKALVLHNAMASKGMKTNCVIVSSILQGLVQIGMVSEALIQFQEFREMGIFLDQACYNVVMYALCKLGKLEEAATLLVDMKGKQIFPDVVNYTTLIRGYCLKGRLVEAVKLLEEMKENGLNPDVITYNILADGFSRNGRTQMVLNLLHYMEAQGLKPNTVTHNMIIEGLCIGGKVEDAEIFLDNLEDKCLENYSALVSGYCEANRTDEAFELFIRLSKQGHITKKNSCLKLLSNLCMEGDNHKGLLLLETMLALQVNPNKIMYSKVIGALCHAGEMKKARHIFDIMVSSGVIDLVTYTMMINGYCRVNCLREAYDLLQDMENRGIKPDVITYTVLLDGCSKQSFDSMKRKEKIARAFWREMKDMDIQLDSICYTVLIDSHCKANNIKEALRLFDDMIDRGIQPDTVTYTALLSGYCRVGDIDKAVLLFNEMLYKEIPPDDHTFSTLRHGVLKAKRVTLVAHRQQLNSMLNQLFKAKRSRLSC